MTTLCGEAERGVDDFVEETCLSNSSRGHEENYVRFAHFSFEVFLKQNLPLGLKVKKIKKRSSPPNHCLSLCS